MARLVEAVRPGARLVLVGDPGQLTSIEAGAVLGDIVGPAAERPTDEASADEFPAGAAIEGGVVVLDKVHRFGGATAAVADAIRRGDSDAVIEALSDAPDEVTWLPVHVAAPDARAALAPVHDAAVTAARGVIDAAREGDARRALEALGSFRVLCAHRRGPYSVAMWMDRIERWLAAEVEGFGAEGRWYVGRPLLVTENDYGLRLYNGDTGVVIATEAGRVSAAFERSGEVVGFSPSRLAAVDTVYAMTVHKSQGSQFDAAAVLLPDPASQILTRELLYTAVTRARRRLILAGTEDTIRAAIGRPVARASGLRWRLWGNKTAN
jgi:exodeoxyribonuclease V alpha subunit